MEDALASTLVTPLGRSIKFTPERLNQIRNLVERGMSREQIACTIGVTLNSLAVTCSRAGISLRCPKEVNGSRQKPMALSAEATGPKPLWPQPSLVLLFKYRGLERTFDLSLSAEDIFSLVLAAEIEGKKLGQFVVDALRLVVASHWDRDKQSRTIR